MKDKLSIIVPCKNEENYITWLLNDLKMQEGIKDVEIYIADASTDSTRKVIIQNSNGLRINIIDGGPVSIAKNNGAKLVTTPYILFIDADVRFFSRTVIQDTVGLLEEKDLDLIGLKIKCYDGSLRTSLGFAIFNFINKILSRWSPFAVGAYMLTRADKFNELGGFPEKYATSEDYFLSKKYHPSKFMIADEYFGQDSRRFKKMGYLGMSWYLIKNFLNRNNEKHWKTIDGKNYW
jgi:glycosyltransferase involved in cell wall biosynthesis